MANGWIPEPLSVMSGPLKTGDKTMEKKKQAKIGILGYGEVGQAIAKFYKNPRIKDLKRDVGLAGAEILHVCLPW